MPARTYAILLGCVVSIIVGAVAMSWTFGTHARLERVVTELLTEDTELDIQRNLSPYCWVGSCPSVTLVSTLPTSVSDTEATLRLSMLRQEFATEYVDGWYVGVRPETTVRYRVTRADTGSRIEMTASNGR